MIYSSPYRCILATLYLLAFASAKLGSFSSGVRQVWHGDKLLFDDSASMESREYKIPMKSKSTFLSQRGHTDAVVAIAVMQLIERGKMGLNISISSYLDSTDYAAFGFEADQVWCPTVQSTGACQDMSVRQLLSMSSGLIDSSTCDYPTGSWQLDYCTSDARAGAERSNLKTAVSAFIRNPLSHQPGDSFVYAHENTLLLAYVVEKITGQALTKYLALNVFNPLGMESTFLDIGSQQLSLFAEPSSYVEYYDIMSKNDSPVLFAEGSCRALEKRVSRISVGDLISTIPDMVRLYSSLFVAQNSSNVLSLSSRALMLTSHGVIPNNQCLLSNGGLDHVCRYGLGVKLLLTKDDSPQLLAFGSDSSKRDSCFWSSVIVYDDSNALTHPLVAGFFSNNREVFVDRAEWAASFNDDSKCIACNSPISTDNFSQKMVHYYSSMEDNEVRGYHGESDDIGERDMSVGLVVAVVVVPIFIVTAMWLVIVTDYHRKIILKTPVEQAERLRRIQAQLRAQGKEIPNEMAAAEADVENPLASAHGLR